MPATESAGVPNKAWKYLMLSVAVENLFLYRQTSLQFLICCLIPCGLHLVRRGVCLQALLFKQLGYDFDLK